MPTIACGTTSWRFLDRIIGGRGWAIPSFAERSDGSAGIRLRRCVKPYGVRRDPAASEKGDLITSEATTPFRQVQLPC